LTEGLQSRGRPAVVPTAGSGDPHRTGTRQAFAAVPLHPGRFAESLQETRARDATSVKLVAR